MTDDADPRAQLQYQVRFAYGPAGERELAAADVVVVADEISAPASELSAPASELSDPASAPASDLPGSEPEVPDVATIATASAVAQRILAAQTQRGDRVSVAVIARGRADVSFAVEDLLAAGAVIDALAEIGIDHCSPEAAAAAAAYIGLRRATT
ncbi:MAG: phosphosulfolactate phosphohydrolase, partial [Micrococcales bacterium]|nr:phosphosulfolactate phosphohydrolase [Micrococcales bacterium]